jgi:hypothetical protein
MSTGTAIVGLATVLPVGDALNGWELPLTAILQGRGTQALDRESLLFASAGVAAAQQAALTKPAATGVVCGTCAAGETNYRRVLGAVEGTGEGLNPTWGPRSSFNAPAAELSMRIGATGPLLTVTSGEAAGLEAVLLAHDLLVAGRAPAVLAGGVEAYGHGEAPEAATAVLALSAGAGGGTGRVLARVEGTASVFVPTDDCAALQGAARAALHQALVDSQSAPNDVDLVVTAPTRNISTFSLLETVLDTFDGFDAPRLALDDVPWAVDGAGSALAALVAVLAVGHSARRVIVSALEDDGRALALVVGQPHQEGDI